MNWISVKDKLPEDGEVVHFSSEGSAGTTKFEKGQFEYDQKTEEYASVAGIGTPDRVLKWARKDRHNLTAERFFSGKLSNCQPYSKQ